MVVVFIIKIDILEILKKVIKMAELFILFQVVEDMREILRIIKVLAEVFLIVKAVRENMSETL